MQAPLFADSVYPEGFRYVADFLSLAEEAELLARCRELSFAPYVYQGYKAKRQVIAFTEETRIPHFLLPFIVRGAAAFSLDQKAIAHVLVTEYAPGTPIGWHRDMPPYEAVIGISLGAPAPFRFRRPRGRRFDRVTVSVLPRSLYLLSGPARSEWQHSIPPLAEWRYSITMRTAPIP